MNLHASHTLVVYYESMKRKLIYTLGDPAPKAPSIFF
jgi:hypothetical protein